MRIKSDFIYRFNFCACSLGQEHEKTEYRIGFYAPSTEADGVPDYREGFAY